MIPSVTVKVKPKFRLKACMAISKLLYCINVESAYNFYNWFMDDLIEHQYKYIQTKTVSKKS